MNRSTGAEAPSDWHLTTRVAETLIKVVELLRSVSLRLASTRERIFLLRIDLSDHLKNRIRRFYLA
jgi:hypothetical protein